MPCSDDAPRRLQGYPGALRALVGDAERVASERLSRKLEAQLESEREVVPASIETALSSTGKGSV